MSTAAVPARRFAARDLALIAVFAGVIAVFGAMPKIPVGSVGVPIVLQNVAVMLAGCVLGGRRGFLAALVFDLLVLMGLPLLSGGRGGLGLLVSPTAGYFLSYPFVAGLIGRLAERGAPSPSAGRLIAANVVGGLLLCYAFGVVGLLVNAHLSIGAAVTANGPFIPGDLAKAVVAGLVAASVHRAVPGLLVRR